MISQQAIQKAAEELDEYRKRTLKNADNDIMVTALQAVKSSFVDGATWINQQYEPLIEALERAIEHAEFGKISVDNTISLIQALQKLKQHT